MKILIISDIHENFDNHVKVLKKIPELGVEKIFCLGDLINGGIGRMLAMQEIPTHLIWGNNDGNKIGVMKAFFKANNRSVIVNNEFDVCKIDGKRLFLTHYPIIAKSIAKSGDYDAVFYGHNHEKHMQRVGNCLLLNPGEISAHKTHICSYAVHDTLSNTAEIFELDDSKNLLSQETLGYLGSNVT